VSVPPQVPSVPCGIGVDDDGEAEDEPVVPSSPSLEVAEVGASGVDDNGAWAFG